MKYLIHFYIHHQSKPESVDVIESDKLLILLIIDF